MSCLLATAVLAHAEGPAVSELNGKFSIESGVVGATGQSSATGVAQGSISTPLGRRFGLQIDGLSASSHNAFFGGGGAQLFWRDPATGLFGPMAAVVGGGGARAGLYGGEAELYAGLFTLGARAGYRDAHSSSGGFYLGTLTVYPMPDLALSIEGGQIVGQAIGQGTIELQPGLLHNVSLFAEGAAGELGYYRATAGIRIYFGADKLLIRRHREDDPSSSVVGLGGINSGSGHTGIFNSGDGNNGFFNTAITGNTGIFNSGDTNTGF